MGAPVTRPLSTRQHLAHLCSLSFCKQFSVTQLTIQLIDSTYTGGGNVFTERGPKLPPGCLACPVRTSWISGIQACSMSARTCSAFAVRVPINNDFSLSTPLHQLQAALQSVRSQFFPGRHPILSVVLVCLSRFVSEVGCQAAQEKGRDAVS